MLPEYVVHIQNANSTFLPIFLGLYRITCAGVDLMLYLTLTVLRKEEVSKIYDLKGSLYNREAKPQKTTGVEILKDVDWRKSNEIMQVPRETKQLMMGALHKDIEFLSKYNLMDYSLLIGFAEDIVWRPGDSCLVLQGFEWIPGKILEIRDRASVGNHLSPRTLRAKLANPEFLVSVNVSGDEVFATPDQIRHPSYKTAQGNQWLVDFSTRHETGILSEDMRRTYYVGLVDCLQDYNFRKTMEEIWYRVNPTVNASNASCIPPAKYKIRFMDFLTKNVLFSTVLQKPMTQRKIVRT